MPRPKSPVPKYCLHKPSGRAYVRINRQSIYLGKFKSQESLEEYRRILAEFPTPESRTIVIAPGQPLSMAALAARYVEHAKSKYGADSEWMDTIRAAITPLLHLFASLPVEDFSPKKLRAVRKRIIDVGNRSKRRSGDDTFRPLTSTYVNRLSGQIVAMFKWAVGEEFVSAPIWHALTTVPAITKRDARRDEKLMEPKPVRPVLQANIEAVLPVVLPEVAAMIRLQLCAPLRPDEITIIRPMDLDITSELWTYSVPAHKNDWRDGDDEKVVYLGPKAQDILRPWVAACPSNSDYLFSPSRGTKLRWATRRKRPPKVQKWQRTLHDRYDDASYRRAVTRACEKAGVPRWTPNQLRHTGATNVRRAMGVEASQAALGHKNISTTQIYAEKSEQLQREVARKLG